MDRRKLAIENSLLKSEIARLKQKIAEYSHIERKSPLKLPEKSQQPVKATVSMVSPKESLLEFLEDYYQASKKSAAPEKHRVSAAQNVKPVAVTATAAVVKINKTFATYNPENEYSEIEHKISQMKEIITDRLRKETVASQPKPTAKKRKPGTKNLMTSSVKVTPKPSQRGARQTTFINQLSPYGSCGGCNKTKKKSSLSRPLSASVIAKSVAKTTPQSSSKKTKLVPKVLRSAFSIYSAPKIAKKRPSKL